jgi:hypothetical protein
MSKGVESILVTRYEIVVLPKVELVVAKCVPTTIKMNYSEPKFNQQNGSIIKGAIRDWSKRIHNVNRVLKLNSPHYTYCHHIRH